MKFLVLSDLSQDEQNSNGFFHMPQMPNMGHAFDGYGGGNFMAAGGAPTTGLRTDPSEVEGELLPL